MSGWVYIVRSAPGFPIKIGSTSLLRTRRKALRCPYGAKVNVVKAFRLNNYKEVERLTHDNLGHSRLDGEWYTMEAEDAISAVYEAIAELAEYDAEVEKALKIARPLWSDASQSSAAFIAEKAGCSVRLLYDNLGPRSRAKARQSRRDKRK